MTHKPRGKPYPAAFLAGVAAQEQCQAASQDLARALAELERLIGVYRQLHPAFASTGYGEELLTSLERSVAPFSVRADVSHEPCDEHDLAQVPS